MNDLLNTNPAKWLRQSNESYAKREYSAGKKESGFNRRVYWVHEDDEETLKAFVKQLRDARG